MKKFIITSSIITAVLVAGILSAAGWYFSEKVMHPPKPDKLKCSADHFVYCNDPKKDLGLEFENVSFISQRKYNLKGWFIPVKGSKKIVITVHGHGANRYEGARWFKTLHKAGFNILTFDLRNSGQSTKDITSMGYYERYDVIAAVDFAEKQKGMKSIGVFGVSMGSSSSIPAMALDKRIKAGVFEASLANLQDQFGDMLTRDFGLPKFPILNTAILFFEIRAGVDLNQMNNENIIGEISPRPVFLIHCSRDNYIGYSHGLRMFKAAKEPKQTWTTDCDKHAEAWQSDPEKAEKLVTEFFIKNL
ncbi:MAG: alpha/beta hydrolase [Spirochaetae bacterium HGW-Spirochaetae-5]|nr:MAG: alpha/beta hydrolase [Spirochaetae bacterium HGW-Spirochaetae-5]